MLQDTPEQHETRAVAIAALTLVESLIATLAEEKILTLDQTQRLFQAASQSLTAFPQPDAGATNAKVLLDGVAKIVGRHFRYL